MKVAGKHATVVSDIHNIFDWSLSLVFVFFWTIVLSLGKVRSTIIAHSTIEAEYLANASVIFAII